MRNPLYILAPAIFLMFMACTVKKTEEAAPVNRVVYEDSIFTASFFPKGNGFTGGDGTYSIQLPNGETLWIFGDTFIGNVTADSQRIKTTPAYIRNSFVFIEDDRLRLLQQGTPQEFKSMMIPPEVADGSSGLSELQLWYWPGDAFIEGRNLNVFASKFFQRDHEDMWGFEFRGTELLQFTLPDFTLSGVHKFNELDSVHYGHAVHETAEYTYIYGLKNERPYVARARQGNVRGRWEFYNGRAWVADAKEAVPMLSFTGSEQFSVFEHDGTYVLIMQEGDLGRKIYSYTSSTPFGPWANRRMIYETPVPENCGKCWTYNALAHPQFTVDDLLLISYNTNSMRMQDHYDNALIYRPRFVRVPLELIIDR